MNARQIKPIRTTGNVLSIECEGTRHLILHISSPPTILCLITSLCLPLGKQNHDKKRERAIHALIVHRIKELIGMLTCNSDSISVIYNLMLIITPVIMAIISRFLFEIILIISHQASLVIEGKNILARRCSTCKNGHLCQLVKAKSHDRIVLQCQRL